jgi:hypothetical protein
VCYERGYGNDENSQKRSAHGLLGVITEKEQQRNGEKTAAKPCERGPYSDQNPGCGKNDAVHDETPLRDYNQIGQTTFLLF